VLVLLMRGIYEVSTDMSSDGAICIPCFMLISSGIQVILRLLPEQLERLLCSYLWREGFIIYATEMASGGTIYVPSFMKISTGF
jgi:hypothetical protein